MDTQRKRVLMFGWEFPPVISGGLGVATLGLCKALAPHADMLMIIPKSVPNFGIPNIELVGLNSLGKDDLAKLFKSTVKVSNHVGAKIASETQENEADDASEFGPYSTIASDEYVDARFYEIYHSEVKPFEINNLYGGDVIGKVIEFSRLAVQFCLNRDFDIIHAHDWMTFLPALELKKKTGKPLVLHIHSTEYDRAGAHSKNWVYELERKAMEQADWIIPVSNYTGAICVNHYGAHWNKIKTVHNGIDLVQRTIKPKHDSTKYVIFFGRITMQKGPEYFVEAARKVLSVQPNIEFVMAGSGDLLTEMIERTARYGLGNKFFFTGFLNKKMLNELLAIADVYCMPSVSEPFGLSAVEAVQYGIPTIISKTSGVAEVLSGSLAIDFYDVNRFAEYIIQAINDEGLKESIVTANNQSLKSITWENCAEKVMDIYNLPLPPNSNFT